jgi:hypothetical protein
MGQKMKKRDRGEKIACNSARSLLSPTISMEGYQPLIIVI